MECLQIRGGKKLTGKVTISSSKNSAVALLTAATLCDEIVTIENYPDIIDTNRIINLLRHLNVYVDVDGNQLEICSKDIIEKPLITEDVTKMRASYYFMGALLGKFKKVTISMPGGCNLGPRPIDLHLKGFSALGAKIINEDDIIYLEAKELKGANVYLDFPSVGATVNIMLAAVRANGRTVIDNAAKEPEVVDVANMLNSMGAKIHGAGTSEIRIDGVNYLHSAKHQGIPDRIEAGTYVIIGVACGDNIRIENVIPQHLDSLISKLKEMGANIEVFEDYLIIHESKNLESVNIRTGVYPGFATDLQSSFLTLLTQAKGVARVKEKIFESRFKVCSELKRLGAEIKVNDAQNEAIVIGPRKLKGREVYATDLRAGVSLVLAGLIADGETIVYNIEHINRGYQNIVEKLCDLGAKVKKIRI